MLSAPRRQSPHTHAPVPALSLVLVPGLPATVTTGVRRTTGTGYLIGEVRVAVVAAATVTTGGHVPLVGDVLHGNSIVAPTFTAAPG